MKGWTLAGLFLLAFAVQTSLLVPLSLWGVRPDLVLVLVCVIALNDGPFEGAGSGLMAGLFGDFVGGRLIGLGALSMMAAGAAVGWMGQRVFRENAYVPVAVVLAASVIEHVLYLFGIRAFGVNFPLIESFYRIILPSAWYDAVAAAVFYPVFARVARYSGRLSADPKPGPIGG